MRSAEASVYFSQLGRDYRGAANISKADARGLIAQKRTEDDYKAALLALRLNNHKVVVRETKEREQRDVQELIMAEGNSFNIVLNALPSNRSRQWDIRAEKLNGMADVGQLYAKAQENITTGDPLTLRLIGGLFTFATRLAQSDLISQQKSFVRTNQLETKGNRFIDLVEFANVRSMTLKVDGFSLEDFSKEQFNNKTSSKKLSNYFSVFMTLISTNQLKDIEEQVDEQNSSGYSQKYPFIQRNSIYEAWGSVASLYIDYVWKNTVIEPNKNSQDPSLTAMARSAENFLERFDSFKTVLFKHTFAPTTPDAIQLGEEVIKYITEGKTQYIRKYAANLLGILDTQELRNAYRNAEKKVNDPKNGEYFQKLAAGLKHIIEEINIDELPSAEDFELSVDKDVDITNQQIPSTRQLGANVQKLVRTSDWEEYFVMKDDIDWAKIGVKRPQIATVGVGKKPDQLQIKLTYTNELGENLNVGYMIDCGKDTFDWIAVEDPAEYEDMQRRYKLAADAMVSNLLVQVQEDERKKPQDSLTVPQQAQQRPQKAAKAQYIPLLKEPKVRKGHEIITPIKLAQAEDLETRPQSKVKRNIVIPKEVSLPPILKAKVDMYNETGAGNMRDLAIAGPNGEKLYRLRAGNWRLLVEDGDIVNGVRQLVYFEHRDRKDVYRNI